MNWTRERKLLPIAIVLGIATFLGVFGGARNTFRDAMTIPGLIFSGLFYPQGIDTGRGTIVPFYLTMAGNFLAYVGFWRGVMAFGNWLVERKR